jgi:DNA invertase Pin-like site-specific DNA recombinase
MYGYTRVSTTEQAADGKSSLEDQARRIQGVAMMRGEKVAEMFSDPGVSGSKALASRPSGARLVLKVKGGDTIVVAKLDRMFRSAKDALTTAEEWQGKGIKLVVADVGTEPVTENGMSKLFFSMLAAFAEFERSRIAERMLDGRRGKQAKGGSVGGGVPYGYRRLGKGVDAVMVENPREQEVICRARELLELHGGKISRVVTALRQEGRVARSGQAFEYTQVKRMLTTKTA